MFQSGLTAPASAGSLARTLGVTIKWELSLRSEASHGMAPRSSSTSVLSGFPCLILAVCFRLVQRASVKCLVQNQICSARQPFYRSLSLLTAAWLLALAQSAAEALRAGALACRCLTSKQERRTGDSLSSKEDQTAIASSGLIQTLWSQADSRLETFRSFVRTRRPV